MATREVTTMRGPLQVPADRDWRGGEEMVCYLAGEPVTALKREGCVDDENETTPWVEYWIDGELVHRSAHVQLKRKAGAPASSVVSNFG